MIIPFIFFCNIGGFMNDKSKLTNSFIDPYLLKYIRCNNDRDISVTGENNRLISRFNNIIGDENKMESIMYPNKTLSEFEERYIALFDDKYMEGKSSLQKMYKSKNRVGIRTVIDDLIKAIRSNGFNIVIYTTTEFADIYYSRYNTIHHGDDLKSMIDDFSSKAIILVDTDTLYREDIIALENKFKVYGFYNKLL